MSFAGSLVTFAKLQELMTSRPVVFPGLPIAFGLAIVLAAVNMIGGFVVTDRMLQMFTRKKPAPKREADA